MAPSYASRRMHKEVHTTCMPWGLFIDTHTQTIESTQPVFRYAQSSRISTQYSIARLFEAHWQRVI